MPTFKQALAIFIGITCSAGLAAQSVKTTKVTQKMWEEEWRKKGTQFQELLKTLNLTPAGAAANPNECASIFQATIPGGTGGFVYVVAPVVRAKLTDVKGFVRESVGGSPWWQCPFVAGKQCGQIVAPNNPTGAIHPGGAAYMPYEIIDLDDGKTMIKVQFVGWAAGYTRDIRLEADYVK